MLTFLVLIVLLLGATTIVALTIGNLRGASDAAASAGAFTAADTGAEYAQHVYNWDALNPDAAPSCLGTLQNQQVDALPTEELRYDLTVDARRAGETGPPVACTDIADFDAALRNGDAALCMEARGEARNGAVQRRVTNDAFTAPHPGCGRD